MLEGALYLASSFWLGALHAATPGHGKTVAAAYLVGARGRVVDALVLGIFVTLAHTGGIVAFGVLATLGSSALLPQRAEGYLALVTGLLIIGIGLWMLRSYWPVLPFRGLVASRIDPGHIHEHDSVQQVPTNPHQHRDGWGRPHTHVVPGTGRPSLGLLLGLGIAGGVLPDPAALAVLLAAMASGKLVLGLLTVLIFSLGFASVLIAVGVVAARAGTLVLDRLGSGRWLGWLQIATAGLITVVGIVLTLGAWRTIETLH